MTPFEEDLYRLVQDLRKGTNPFTSKIEDDSSDAQMVLEFSKKWDFKDKYIRSLADFENLVKRTDKEKAEWTKKLVVEVLKEMLPVLDVCYQLLQHTDEKSPLRPPVQIVIDNLHKILERRDGGTIWPKPGEEFNPDTHRAIEVVRSDSHKGNQIISVFRCGYRASGLIIRPAEVKVSMGSP